VEAMAAEVTAETAVVHPGHTMVVEMKAAGLPHQAAAMGEEEGNTTQ